MLLSTPLFLLFFFNDLNSADDVLVEHQFNAVMVQDGLKIEVEGSGPDAYVVEAVSYTHLTLPTMDSV